MIHQPNHKTYEKPNISNKNGTTLSSNINKEAAIKPDPKPDSINTDLSRITPGQQISTNNQLYNGVDPSEGLRHRNGANKNDKIKKSERSVSIQPTAEMSPLIDSDMSAVSDLERTTSLKGITVFKGRVPGESINACEKPYCNYNERGNSNSISLASNPNTVTSASARSCATAITDGHIIHYGDEHVESYL